MEQKQLDTEASVIASINSNVLTISSSEANAIGSLELIEVLKSAQTKELITKVFVSVATMCGSGLFDYIKTFLSESRNVNTISIIYYKCNNELYDLKYVFDLLQASMSVTEVNLMLDDLECNYAEMCLMANYLSTTTVSTLSLDMSSSMATELIGIILENNSVKNLSMNLDTCHQIQNNLYHRINATVNIAGQVAGSNLEKFFLDGWSNAIEETFESIIESLEEKFENNFSINEIYVAFCTENNRYVEHFNKITKRNASSNEKRRFKRTKVAESD